MANEFSEDYLAGMAAAREIAEQTTKGKTAAYAINRKIVRIRLQKEAMRRAQIAEYEKFFSFLFMYGAVREVASKQAPKND